jgi:hypothetical protein
VDDVASTGSLSRRPASLPDVHRFNRRTARSRRPGETAAPRFFVSLTKRCLERPDEAIGNRYVDPPGNRVRQCGHGGRSQAVRSRSSITSPQTAAPARRTGGQRPRTTRSTRTRPACDHHDHHLRRRPSLLPTTARRPGYRSGNSRRSTSPAGTVTSSRNATDRTATRHSRAAARRTRKTPPSGALDQIYGARLRKRSRLHERQHARQLVPVLIR